MTGTQAMMGTSESQPKTTARYPARRNAVTATTQARSCRRQPNEAERICGTCGASYSSAEMTDEVPACDDTSDMTGDPARGALRTGGSSSDVCCLTFRGSGTG